MKVVLKVLLLSVVQVLLFIILVSLSTCFYSLIIGYEPNIQRGVFFKTYIIAYSIVILLTNLIFENSKLTRKSLGGIMLILIFIIALLIVFVNSVIYLPLSSLLVFCVTIFVLLVTPLLDRLSFIMFKSYK